MPRVGRRSLSSGPLQDRQPVLTFSVSLHPRFRRNTSVGSSQTLQKQANINYRLLRQIFGISRYSVCALKLFLTRIRKINPHHPLPRAPLQTQLKIEKHLKKENALGANSWLISKNGIPSPALLRKNMSCPLFPHQTKIHFELSMDGSRSLSVSETQWNK
jgi:hypothetical protein